MRRYVLERAEIADLKDESTVRETGIATSASRLFPRVPSRATYPDRAGGPVDPLDGHHAPHDP